MQPQNITLNKRDDRQIRVLNIFVLTFWVYLTEVDTNQVLFQAKTNPSEFARSTLTTSLSWSLFTSTQSKVKMFDPSIATFIAEESNWQCFLLQTYMISSEIKPNCNQRTYMPFSESLSPWKFWFYYRIDKRSDKKSVAITKHPKVTETFFELRQNIKNKLNKKGKYFTHQL